EKGRLALLERPRQLTSRRRPRADLTEQRHPADLTVVLEDASIRDAADAQVLEFHRLSRRWNSIQLTTMRAAKDPVRCDAIAIHYLLEQLCREIGECAEHRRKRDAECVQARVIGERRLAAAEDLAERRPND